MIWVPDMVAQLMVGTFLGWGVDCTFSELSHGSYIFSIPYKARCKLRLAWSATSAAVCERIDRPLDLLSDDGDTIVPAHLGNSYISIPGAFE